MLYVFVIMEIGTRKMLHFNVTAHPTTDSVRKVLYLAIQKASQRWNRPIRDWPAVLNHFTIVFEERVPN